MGKELVNKRIFLFYRWGMRIVPILLMLVHWLYAYCVRNIWEYDNLDMPATLIAPMYAMTYIFPLAFMLPASYFFKFCDIWRVPFAYLIGVNLLHAWYASFVCTPQIAEHCRILIYAVLAMYVWLLLRRVNRLSKA